MPDTPERVAEVVPKPESVIERPEQMVVPERIQDIAKPTSTQMTSQVTDDAGQPLTQSSDDTQTPTIQIPADPQQLSDLTKGLPTDAVTWFATFWVRMLKKALHFGWKIVKKEGGTQSGS